MCVIAIAEKKRLTAEQIRACHCANSHGIGIAWTEGKQTKYKKDIKMDEAIRLAQLLPMPYIYHFRLATAGGHSSLLCHPFVIEENSPVATEGSSNYVLFHNGHVNGYEQLQSKFDLKLDGPVSDSRVVAAIVADVGYKVLHLISGKYAILGEGAFWTFGGDWTESDGIHFSNMYWQYRSFQGGGDWDYSGRSSIHNVSVSCDPRLITDSKKNQSEKVVLTAEDEAYIEYWMNQS